MPRRFARLPRIIAALALALPLLGGGCGRDDRPGVILVVMDTTCFDRLGCTGHESATTAALDSLAAAGTRFATAVTAVPVTAPSVATILTGVTPAVHGVRDNGRFTLHDDLRTLAEAFADAGYRTGAVVGAVPVLGRFGYARGFEIYDDDFGNDAYSVFAEELRPQEDELGRSERRAGAVTDRALAWLRTLPTGDPYFLVVHYYDPHTPTDPPPPYRRLHPDDPYDAEVAYMDAEIGRLLAGARSRDLQRTLCVAAVGDHGEAFFARGEPTHGYFVYDTTVRVPLIFAGPGVLPGRVVDEPVRTVDVAPTLCGWAGVDLLPMAEGVDLTPVLGGADAPPAVCDTAYVETFMTQLTHNWSPLQSVRTRQWKRIRAPRPELYDLAADPQETTNLDARALPVAAVLDAWLDDYLFSAAIAREAYGARQADIDPALARQLASLGYAGSGAGGSVDPDYGLPDPKDGLPALNDLMMWYQLRLDATACLAAGRNLQAVQLLDRSWDAWPDTPLARNEAGKLLGGSGLDALAAAARRERDADVRARLQAHLERSRQLVNSGRRQ